MRKIKLVKRLEINLPWVEADPNELEQVVLNLVNNAIDAMPEGGVLTIETKNSLVDGAETLSEVSGVDQLVIIQVEDTGTGIPEENVHRIFDPFFTTKEVSKGTGLGLSISYGIVKNLGGTIEVASSPGAGTIFTVKVPTDGR